MTKALTLYKGNFEVYGFIIQELRAQPDTIEIKEREG